MKNRILTTIIATAMLAFGLQAQAQKNWKDRAEFDLYDSIVKDTNAQTRLQNLDKWKSTYAQSEYADVRLKAYLVTYQQLMKHREAIDTASEILKSDPNDIASLTEIIGYVLTLLPAQANAQLNAQNRSDIELGEKTAKYVVDNIDAIYAADKKPQGTTDEQWAAAKPTIRNFSQFTLARLAVVAKDVAKAETELSKTVQMDPANAQAAYMLAGNLLAQQKTAPEKMPTALFEYARAASYDGPGALDAATRKQVDAFLTKAYTAYHGSAQGLNDVKTAAKASAMPPAGFSIKSTVDIAKEAEAARQEKAKQNPMLAFWEDLKENLTGDGSAQYWEAVKDAGLPGGKDGVTKFKGKIISMTPETNPKEILLSVASGTNADAKIVLDEPLPGNMEAGMEIGFSGAAKEFSKEPYLLTFESAPTDIEGWTGKGTVRGGRGGAAKKAAPGAAPAAPATKKKQ
jgi:tetratricopeptide (TPR) repeat protein